MKPTAMGKYLETSTHEVGTRVKNLYQRPLKQMLIPPSKKKQ